MYRAYFAALLAVCLTAGAQSAKKYKDAGEYEIYSAVAKDLAAQDFAKAITDLESWKQRYPQSEFSDERQFLAVQAYAAAKQPGKAVAQAAGMVGKDVGGPANQVKLLVTTALSIQQVPDPSPEQLDTAGKAARALEVFDSKPEGVTAEAWTQARGQLQAVARAARIYVGLAPGAPAMKRKDCAAAEGIFLKAVEANPESGQAAWSLGTAQLCLYASQPEKAAPALYQMARAAALDPAKGLVDPKWQRETVTPYLEKIYTRYHGADPEGLNELKRLAVQSPLPPAGFTVKSVSQIAREKEEELSKTNPQLALWMKIKAALADTGGDQYFATSLKDAAVPQLRGVLVEAKPACRPKELLVAVPAPGAQPPFPAEITLKLEKPLAGKPDPNSEFRWTGVPTAFSASPFMLTMETGQLEGLRAAPCGGGAARKR